MVVNRGEMMNETVIFKVYNKIVGNDISQCQAVVEALLPADKNGNLIKELIHNETWLFENEMKADMGQHVKRDDKQYRSVEKWTAKFTNWSDVQTSVDNIINNSLEIIKQAYSFNYVRHNIPECSKVEYKLGDLYDE